MFHVMPFDRKKRLHHFFGWSHEVVKKKITKEYLRSVVFHEWAASFLINSVFPFQDVHPVNHEDRDRLLPFGQRRQVSTLCLLSRSRQVVGKDCHRLNKGSGSTTRKWHLWEWTMGSKAG